MNGLNIIPSTDPMGFIYGEDCFGLEVENRRLNDIRRSLQDLDCDGPEIVYSIAMDVGKKVHRELLNKMHLLYGVVIYAAGRLGEEPVRSQGHIHKVSPLSGWSTPEVYEIWSGSAIIYMQEFAKDDPGRCFAVSANAGDVVIVPPYWTHATINADPANPLIFGAWCDRQYGFEYEDVRAHNGIAWYPHFDENNKVIWVRNPLYNKSELITKPPRDYKDLGIQAGVSIYETFENDPNTFLYVPHPELKKEIWENFTP